VSSRPSQELADVNVLLALVWPRHAHHSAAQVWFSAQGHKGWATNSITQLGVVRLLTNPAVTRGAVNAATALATLAEATSHPNHQFWPLDRPVPSVLAGVASEVTGYRQWTDLLLLRQATERKGKLVTFDVALQALVNREERAHLLILQG
jgi:toxin-antitoxin system PIN domain toxin